MKKGFKNNFLLVAGLAITFCSSTFAQTMVATTATMPQVTLINCVSLTVPLSFGKKDTIKMKEVAVLQHYLKDNGYLSDSPTGYFGKATRKAVMTFQNAYSIELTGIVGPVTRAKIRELTCGPAKTTSTNPVTSITPSVPVSGQMSGQPTVVTQSQTPVVSQPTTPPTESSQPSSAPYQAYVGGQLQIDASSVPKSYADESCKKIASANTANTIICKWNSKEIFSYIPTAIPSAPTPTPEPIPTTQAPVVPQGPPSVFLNIGPTSVPYGGGYDYFELKTVGMATCTLYFKEEPSNTWISSGSSLGVNFTFPGFKGMTKSKSYYVSCKDSSNQKMDSTVVTINVASQ